MQVEADAEESCKHAGADVISLYEAQQELRHVGVVLFVLFGQLLGCGKGHPEDARGF